MLLFFGDCDIIFILNKYKFLNFSQQKYATEEFHTNI